MVFFLYFWFAIFSLYTVWLIKVGSFIEAILLIVLLVLIYNRLKVITNI